MTLCCSAVLSSGQVNVTTFHNDNARTGQNTAETILTPANVNSNQFGKLFSVTVDGYVYAQPLYMSNVSIAGGTHNVLYVATEHDSLYAIDADNGTVLWQQSFINPAAGITSVPSGDTVCTDLVPEVGITSTPVIDPTTSTIYLVTKTKENGSYFQRLHALDIVTHAEKFGGPMPITATTSNGRKFNPLRNNQRAALLWEPGHVVIAWAGHCDYSPSGDSYQGWVMSYTSSTLAQEAAFNTEIGNGVYGGVWMAGDGVAADASGNLYFATGNGDYNGTTDFGNSIVKLPAPTANWSPADWFTPWDWSNLNNGDIDLGSGGVLLLPTLTGVAHPQMLVQMGKDGKIHLIDRSTMGKVCSGCNSVDTQIVQEIPSATTGIWGSPAFWNNTVYWGGGNDGGAADNITAWSFNANGNGLLSTSPTSQSAQTFAFSTAAPVISANGNSNGILWILDNSSFESTCCQILYAFDATNLGTMLYNSNQAAGSRDVPGGAVKFTAPVVANGKVYVGGQGKVTAYGKISGTPTAAPPTFSPAPGAYTSAVTVTLSDTTPGATIHCTTNGTTPTSSSPVCTSVSISSTTVLEAIATASGYNNSAVASGTYSIGSGSGVNYGSGFTSTGLTLNGKAQISGTRLRITDGGSYEASSAFVSTPISIQNFTNDFSFQLTNAGADGMTFTIQGVGPTALGPLGGGLGYGPDLTTESPGIGRSVAIKFDLYNNNGEGNNSTGLYTNGASPTTPAIDLTPSGVNLHSGDVFNVHMTYDGATLGMTITDATTAQTFSTSWAINIPSIVGGNTAYLGFTGGTGGLSAVQDIITWTYSTAASAPPPTAATPTFSPAPGTYSSAQSVTLSDTTSGAAIYYTTNGTTPTTSSTKYSSAIAVSSTTTIQAIAVASGYNNSAVATGTYTISSNPSVNFANGFTATGMTFNSVAALSGTRLRLTDGGTYEATSAFYNTPLNVQSFTTRFSFQITNPNADGFAFVIQNSGTTAVGPLGGGLGYGAGSPGGTPGIGKSVAVKFDLYDNSGEGANSTGLYVNGASPTVPATTLGGGVNLHSGDVFNVQLSYDGATLTMTITDASVSSDTFTTSWPVNIPSTVGNNTAYVGFTAGTGGLTATQDIISWTYTPGVSSPPPPPTGTPVVYQAESVPATGTPNARVFTWSGFTNGVGITVDGTQVGNSITLTLNVAQAGTYDVKFGTKLYPTRGIGQLSVSSVNVGTGVDQYSSNYNGVFQEFDLGPVNLTAAGNYPFKFTVTGKSAASTGYTLAFDYIKLTPQ